MLRAGTLFTGIGGFDLGLEQEDFRLSWMSEIDKHASRILWRHFPDTTLYGNVEGVRGDALPTVEVVAFGSPCQDLSRGGEGKGLAGERSGLFYEAIRIVRELIDSGRKPRFIVWENVPGALTSNNGEDFACVLQAFLDIGATDVAWRVLDSQGFGVPQRRRRVFVVADLGGESAAEVLGVFYRSEGNRSSSAHKERKRPAARSSATAGGSRGSGRYWDGSEVSDCLDVSMLTKGQMMPEKRRFPCVYVDTPEGERLRRLTPMECERLQGFPDGWTEGQSNIQRYKQLGNAVTVNVAQWIAGRIKNIMER